MKLNKDQKLSLLEATRLIDLLHGKQKTSENSVKVGWKGKPPLPILVASDIPYHRDSVEHTDEEIRLLLKELAEKSFDLIQRNYPQLWREIKTAFINNKVKDFAMGKEL